jgi:hypothetical protein
MALSRLAIAAPLCGSAGIAALFPQHCSRDAQAPVPEIFSS